MAISQLYCPEASTSSMAGPMHRSASPCGHQPTSRHASSTHPVHMHGHPSSVSTVAQSRHQHRYMVAAGSSPYQAVYMQWSQLVVQAAYCTSCRQQSCRRHVVVTAAHAPLRGWFSGFLAFWHGFGLFSTLALVVPRHYYGGVFGMLGFLGSAAARLQRIATAP